MLTVILVKLITCVIVFAISLGVAAYATLWERKFSALLQDRVGPDRAGPKGLLQPLADGGKMFFKEEIIPNVSNKFLFILYISILFIIPPSLVMIIFNYCRLYTSLHLLKLYLINKLFNTNLHILNRFFF